MSALSMLPARVAIGVFTDPTTRQQVSVTMSPEFYRALRSLDSGTAAMDFQAAGTGAVLRTAEDKLRECKTLWDYGGVADYEGTPLYDGNDSVRVTATDNTVALRNLFAAALAAGHDTVRIPAGHWGIKLGNLSFSGFQRLRVIGDGIGNTILDFILEDSSGAAYVDEAAANAIAMFDGGEYLEFADMTIKATTKAGLVTGLPGSNDVYRGAVWGLKIHNVAEVRLNRVRVERFNYRGVTVWGSSTQRVVMLDCEGINNTSSGFWVADAALLHVMGGEFSYNGIFGETGTGYGVTASNNVWKFLVEAAYFHHNYRKGLDSHGCAQMVVMGCVFENNVLHHIADPNVGPPSAATEIQVIIKGNTFSNGRLTDDYNWLRSCYDQLAANGYATARDATGCVLEISDLSNTGAPLDKITAVVIEDNAVLCHYNGVDGTIMAANMPFFSVIARVARVSIKRNDINLQHAAMVNGSDVYSHVAFPLTAASAEIHGNTVQFTQTTAYTNAISGAADFGAFFGLRGSDDNIELIENTFSFADCLFVTSTGSGIRQPVYWTGSASRIAYRNTWKYTDDQFKGVDGIYDNYFLGRDAVGSVPLKHTGNVFVRGSVRYLFPECNLDKTFNQTEYALNGVSKSAGDDVFYVVLDKQYQTTIRISTDDGSADLFIKVPYSSYTGVTGSTGNAYFELSSVDASYAEDGLTKLKVTIKAKTGLSGNYWGRVVVDGARASFGVEKAVQL